MVYLRRSANDTGVFMCFSKDDVIICNIMKNLHGLLHIAERWSSSIDFIAVIVATNEVYFMTTKCMHISRNITHGLNIYRCLEF